MTADTDRRDARFEQLLGRLLRTGVLLAATVVLAGGVRYLVDHGGEVPGHKTFHGEPAELRTLSGIAGDAMRLDGRGVIMFGLLLLVATPVARVAFSAVGFLRAGDFLYVALTLFVLGVLLFSLLAGTRL